MAIWSFSKTIACGATIASAALVYCFITLHNRREKKKIDKADNNKTFEIKITNSSSSNIHNERETFVKNSANPNTPLISKVRKVVSSISKQNTFNNPIKPPHTHSERLYQIQSKVVEDCDSIMNNARFFTHDESNETIIFNNSSPSFEHGFGNQDNLNCSLVINNSINSINNRVQIKIFNKSIKLSTLNMKILYTSDDLFTKNRCADLITISHKEESKEINIIIPSFNHQRLVEHVMTFHGNRLTNVRNNKCTKERGKNDVTIVIKASM